jgi:hypothetical protein
MAKTDGLTLKEGQDLEPALHFLAGLWLASCPTCGYQLASSQSQQRCERRAARRRCPVCHQDSA